MLLQSQKWAYLDVVPVPPKLNLLMTPDPKRSKGVAGKKKTLEVSMRLLSEYFGWRSKWNHFLLLHTPRNTSLKYWMTCFKIQSKGFLYQKETIRQVWSYYFWTEGDAAYYRCEICALSAGNPTMAGEQSEIPGLKLEICQSADTWWDLNLRGQRRIGR